MALSARTPANAVTYYFIPTLYSSRVLVGTEDQLVAMDAIDASWYTDLVKGNVLDIGKTNNITATEVTVGSKASSLDPFATAGVQLTVNQWYEAPVDIDTMTSRQTHIDMESHAVEKSSFAIAERMDKSVCDLFSSLGGYVTSAYGSDGQTLTDDILLAIIETLNSANVPMDGNRSLIIDPSSLTDLMKIDKFIAAQYVNIGAVTNGIIGTSPIYGCKVRITNNLTAASTGSYGCLLHKEAIGAAAQIDKVWREEYPELHQIRYQAEALWGVIETRDDFGVPFYTRSA